MAKKVSPHGWQRWHWSSTLGWVGGGQIGFMMCFSEEQPGVTRPHSDKTVTRRFK